MTAAEFRLALHKEPFEPFDIRLADGGNVCVPHPDFVAIRGAGGSVIVTRQKAPGFDTVDLALVSHLENPASQPASTKKSMTYDELSNTLHAAPFQPFTIHMADGRSAHVPHPDFIAISEAANLAVVFVEGGRYTRTIDLNLVTELAVQHINTPA